MQRSHYAFFFSFHHSVVRSWLSINCPRTRRCKSFFIFKCLPVCALSFHMHSLSVCSLVVFTQWRFQIKYDRLKKKYCLSKDTEWLLAKFGNQVFLYVSCVWPMSIAKSLLPNFWEKARMSVSVVSCEYCARISFGDVKCWEENSSTVAVPSFWPLDGYWHCL